MESQTQQDCVPLVSICCVCYNHEKYVRQTLDGFLMQKTNFIFEIIVFDDASTDRTQEIISEYALKNPELFRLFLQKENLWQNKGISGTIAYTFPNARGKYIAMCEGDDYWIDPYKLQKQVDFMETNPDYGLVHTNYRRYSQESDVFYDFELDIYTGDVFKQLLKGNYIQTLTVLLRTKLAQELVRDFNNGILPVVPIDYSYWLYIAEKSKIGFLTDYTAVYRKLKESMSNTWNEYKSRAFERSVQNIRIFFAKRTNCFDLVKYQYLDFIRSDLKYAFYAYQKQIASSSYAVLKNDFELRFIDKFYYLGSRNIIINKIFRFCIYLKDKIK